MLHTCSMMFHLFHDSGRDQTKGQTNMHQLLLERGGGGARGAKGGGEATIVSCCCSCSSARDCQKKKKNAMTLIITFGTARTSSSAEECNDTHEASVSLFCTQL